MKSFIAILTCKLMVAAIKVSNYGAGGTWPGYMALKFDQNLLQKLFSNKLTTIFVAGTNGKTTTVKLIVESLKKANKKIITNETGANLLSGITTSLIGQSSLLGKIRHSICVMEVDEGNLPALLTQKSPDFLVLTNLFRDQLDRYGELDNILKKWISQLNKIDLTNTTLILNSNDPLLAYLGIELEKKCKKVLYFGLDDKSLSIEKLSHATDSIYCPRCKSRLNYNLIFLSHLGSWECSNCNLKTPDLDYKNNLFPSSLSGIYNIYNALAAGAVLSEIGINKDHIKNTFEDFAPAFGRQEELTYKGRKIKILLSKNPTGLNEALRTYSDNSAEPLLVALNDRIPDGLDVSWIWDVDFEQYLKGKHNIVATGDRAYDLAIRLKYGEIKSIDYITTNLNEALDKLVEVTEEKKTAWVLATYSAMLEIRKAITNKSIL